MKAKIKKTGEIINLSPSTSLTLNICDSWGNPIVLKPEEIEFIQDKTDDFDWQSFRNQAAKDILAGMMQHKVLSDSSTKLFVPKEQVVSVAIGLADELIKQLKEKEEK